MKFIKFLLALVIILAIIAGAGYAYLSNDPFTEYYDDYTALSENTSESSIIQVNDSKVLISFNKEFVYSTIKINDHLSKLEEKEITLENIGYTLRQDEPMIDIYVSIKYKGVIPAHFHIEAKYSTEGNTLNITVEKITIGKLISIPTSWVETISGISPLSYSYTVSESITKYLPKDMTISNYINEMKAMDDCLVLDVDFAQLFTDYLTQTLNYSSEMISSLVEALLQTLPTLLQ